MSFPAQILSYHFQRGISTLERGYKHIINSYLSAQI